MIIFVQVVVEQWRKIREMEGKRKNELMEMECCEGEKPDLQPEVLYMLLWRVYYPGVLAGIEKTKRITEFSQLCLFAKIQGGHRVDIIDHWLIINHFA